MGAAPTSTRESIRLDEIKVVNPRQRNASSHAGIIENIKNVGLKRPITVSRRTSAEGKYKFDLVCGQGRLEAFAKLGATTIEAEVIEVSAHTGLLMSLIENIARRHRSSLEVMREIAALRERGHTHDMIASIIGAPSSWVSGVLGLLEKGEERLVASVASGTMPLGLAIRIVTGNSHELQAALATAYETKVLRGKQLAMVRQVIKLREHNRLLGSTSTSAAPGGSRAWTPAELLKTYEREAEARHLIVKKAEIVQSMLAFTVEAFKQMLQDPEFVAALESDGVTSMPTSLAKLLDMHEEVQ